MLNRTIQKSFRFFAPAALLCFAAGAAMCQVGQWQSVAPMNWRSSGLGAATGPDGRIYAIGGNDGYNGIVNFVQAYQPQTNTWTQTASMNSARAYFGCVTGPDGRIYAIGGRWNASAEAYDTSSNKWSHIAPLPIDLSTEQVNSAALGNDSKIYAFISPGPPASFPPYLRAYDIATNTWSPIIHPPVTLPYFWSGIASDAAGRIYVAGGQAPDGSSVADVVMFDPRANTWRYVQSMPTPRSYFALAFAGDGRLYAIGGTAATYTEDAAVGAYDPALNSWAPVSPLNVPRARSAATMGLDGRVYVLGGESTSEGNFLAGFSVEVYQPGPSSSGPNVTAASIHAMEGAAFTSVVASFTDTHSANALDFTASIQWGDGQTSSATVSANGSGGFNVTASHLYTRAGSYVTKISVLAAYGGSGSSGGSAAVADARLTAKGLNIVSNSRSFTGMVATFTDANPYAAASDFTAVIQWGDGKFSAGTIKAMATGGFSVTGAHTYRKFGAYTVIVSIKDVGGSAATASTALTVK